jgi:uroporphyrinogen III methyltransferase/synthase
MPCAPWPNSKSANSAARQPIRAFKQPRVQATQRSAHATEQPDNSRALYSLVTRDLDLDLDSTQRRPACVARLEGQNLMQLAKTADAHHPLDGRRVAVVRAIQEPCSLAPAAQALGAQVVVYPSVEIVLVEDALRLAGLTTDAPFSSFDWLLLPTLDAVLALTTAQRAGLLSVAHLIQTRLAIFGALAQQAAAEYLGVSPSATGDDAHQDLLHAMHLTTAFSPRVLLVQPAAARQDWRVRLKAAGASVSVLPLYRARLPQGGDPLPVELWSGSIDAILFGSETDVRYFAARLKHDGGVLAMLDHVCVACLDRATAKAAKALGLHPAVVPDQANPAALAAAVAAFLTKPVRA